MKRYYLTDTLPDKVKVSKRMPPDIRQKMTSYQSGLQETRNTAPQVRPYPLEKYETNKETRLISPVDDVVEEALSEVLPEPTPDPVQQKEEAININSLPANVRVKARRLLPYLNRVNMGDLNVVDLLYDLTTQNTKKIKSHSKEQLQSVLRQLESDTSVPPNLYIRKIGLAVIPISPAHKNVRGSPMRAPSKSTKPIVKYFYSRQWL